MPNMTPKEAEEQAALFRWAEIAAHKWPELRMMYAIPNGGSRHPIEAVHLKEQGVKPGVPDICLPVARGIYHGMYIEMKRQKRGRVSQEQAVWIDRLNRLGYRAVVCRGWDAARLEIEAYLRAER